MPRRKSSFLDDVAAAPWPVGVATGFLILLLGFVVIPSVLSSGRLAVLNGVVIPISVVLALGSWVAAAVSAWNQSRRGKLLDTRTDLASLRGMTWRELEHLVSEAYRRLGYDVEESARAGADGGVDLRLRRQGELTLVQCKHWRTQRVGAPIVREQFGLQAHHHADAVVIVTTGDFTAEAREFARGKPIELVAGTELLSLVQGVQRRAEPPVVARASSPEPAAQSTAASCPLCAAPMVQRTARQNGARFFCCSTFPACRGTRPAA